MFGAFVVFSSFSAVLMGWFCHLEISNLFVVCYKILHRIAKPGKFEALTLPVLVLGCLTDDVL